DQAEPGSAQLVATTQKRLPAMPVKYAANNRQAQTITTGGSGTAVIQARKGGEDFLPILFGNAGAIVFYIDAAGIFIQLAVHHHAAVGVAGSIANQVLDGPVDIAGFHVGQRPAFRSLINT